MTRYMHGHIREGKVNLAHDVRMSLTPEEHMRIAEHIAMAVAEAGHGKRELRWNEEIWGVEYWVEDEPVPNDVLDRARRLAYEHAGVPYIIAEDYE